MITKALQNNNEVLQKRLFLLGAGLFFILALYYCYSINSTVFQVASRKTVESNIHTIKSEVAEMELQYVALQSTVTLESASVLGLVEVSRPLFIGTSKSLSLR